MFDAHWSNTQQNFSQLLAQPLLPLQKIHAIFGNMFNQAESMCSKQGSIYGCPFGNLASELSNSNPDLRALVQRVFAYLTDIYIDLIEQAKATGELLTDLDATQAANTLMAYMQGLSIMGKVYNDPVKMRQNGEYTLDLILGIGRNSP